MPQSKNEKNMGGTWMTMYNFVDMELAKRVDLARKRAIELRAIAE